MLNVCLYFQVHQPHRLRKYTYFDIGKNHDYIDEAANRDILLKVANKCYLPTNALILKLINRYQGAFKVSYSISGTIIEQFKKFSPETLESFQKLAATGCVEFLNETYYHSLSYLFSPHEFKLQVDLHHQLIIQEFGYQAETFRNTELIYNNELAKFIEELGYKTIVAEGAEKFLDWRNANHVYRPDNCKEIKLLLRNYKLSDDIAFRFSNRNWKEFPVTADKYARWIHEHVGNAALINLFMDYETFGEHQWQETGIFNFFEHLPEKLFAHPDCQFMTPHELSKNLKPVATLDIPYFVSWADEERDLTAWRGNNLQEDALATVYALESKIKKTKDSKLLGTWRSLLTSDHFYYMCTKYANDGDVHKYFNPYKNPYDAYINFQNIMADLGMQLDSRK